MNNRTASDGFTSPNRPVRGTLVSPSPGGITPPPARQVTSARNSNNNRPHYNSLPDRVNPYTGNNLRVDAHNAVRVINRLMNTTICTKVLNHKNIRGNLPSYIESINVGVVAKVIHGCSHGFNYRYTNATFCLDSVREEAERSARCNVMEDIQHWQRFVEPLTMFLFNWFIPRSKKITLDAVLAKKLSSWEIHLKSERHGRAGLPLWSNQYFIRRRITKRDSTICNGHFLDYALILDTIIPDFADSLTCDESYLTDAQVWDTLLNVNIPTRLWH